MIKEVSKSETKSDALTEFLIFVLTIIISTFILRLVWNRSLVKHISILKPIKNLTDALILAISISVVRGI
jgi:Na+/H+-dicarboxylate symporter